MLLSGVPNVVCWGVVRFLVKSGARSFYKTHPNDHRRENALVRPGEDE